MTNTHIFETAYRKFCFSCVGVTALCAILLMTATPARADSMRDATVENMTMSRYAKKSMLAARALILDVTQTDRRLIAVGAFGHIIYSDNNGKSWMQADSVPTRTTLTSVYFVDDQLGYAVGHDATVLKTINGGKNWTLVHTDVAGERPLFGVYFSDADNGLAVGAFSLVIETHNGGETWMERPIVADGFDDYHLNDIFAAKDGAIYIPAEFGTIYRSTDRGRNFKSVASDYDGSYWSGLGLVNGDVLIWGMRGNAYRSEDGLSWVPAKTNTDRSIMGGTELKDGRIVLTGLSGLVLTSTDAAVSFTETVRNDRKSFAAVSGARADTVLLYGEVGVLPHRLSK